MSFRDDEIRSRTLSDYVRSVTKADEKEEDREARLSELKSLRKTLRDYIRRQPHGTILDYVTVEQETRIAMSPGPNGKWGRRALIDAAKAEGKEFERMRRGEGIRLLCGDTAATAIQNDLLSVSQQLKNMRDRGIRIVDKHGADMPARDLQAATAQIAFATTVQMSVALNAKAPLSLKK